MTVDVMSRFFALLALLTNVGTVAALVLRFAGPEDLRESMRSVAIPIAALVTVVAMLGSLYFSDVAHFTPCRLCWFQRIFMYPLAFVLTGAAIRRARDAHWYALPLAFVGVPISVYHYLQQRFPNIASSACTADVPCSSTWVWQFGLVSIPYMALSAFLLVLVLVGLYRPVAPEDVDADPGAR